MTVDEIRDYIVRELLNDPDAQVEVDEDLLLTGRLDSLGVMRLISHIEGERGIEVPPEDVVLENFGSLEVIVAYLESRESTSPTE